MCIHEHEWFYAFRFSLNEMLHPTQYPGHHVVLHSMVIVGPVQFAGKDMKSECNIKSILPRSTTLDRIVSFSFPVHTKITPWSNNSLYTFGTFEEYDHRHLLPLFCKPLLDQFYCTTFSVQHWVCQHCPILSYFLQTFDIRSLLHTFILGWFSVLCTFACDITSSWDVANNIQ